jgi:hypothetical protein
MLYANESNSKQTRRIGNIECLYKKYKRVGGFGIYSIASLTGLKVAINDYAGMVQQEDMLIELYSSTNEKTIRKDDLERKYLGRKCVSVENRVRHLILGGNGLPRGIRGKDPYKTFMMSHSIIGHSNRLFWSEKEVERSRFDAM